jgi:ubiquinone biosynthesis protein
VTAEAALTHGVFHADLRPEHLLALPDGRVVVAGCGTIGRLDPPIRRAAIEYLAAVLGGDYEGQVAAMRQTGAVPDDVDVDALVADLSASAALDPMTILAGGEVSLLGALREAMDLLLRHRLRPPLEVVLLVRSLFALRSLLATVAPERSLLDALFPLIARLPELRAGDR